MELSNEELARQRRLSGCTQNRLELMLVISGKSVLNGSENCLNHAINIKLNRSSSLVYRPKR